MQCHESCKLKILDPVCKPSASLCAASANKGAQCGTSNRSPLQNSGGKSIIVLHLSAARQEGWRLRLAGAVARAAQDGAVPAAGDQHHASWDHEGALLEPAQALGLGQGCLAQPVPAQTPWMCAVLMMAVLILQWGQMHAEDLNRLKWRVCCSESAAYGLDASRPLPYVPCVDSRIIVSLMWTTVLLLTTVGRKARFLKKHKSHSQH